MAYKANPEPAVQPHTQPPPRRLASLIGLAARQWRRAIDLRLQPFELTEATWLPLLRLSRAGEPMRQKDLAASLSLDSSSVVRLLKNLETAGLIERGQDEADARAKAIVITPQGADLVRRVEQVSEALEHDLLAEMDAADVTATRRVVTALCAQLERLNEAGSAP